MNDLVNIPCNFETENIPGVLGTQLHKALGIRTEYRHWFRRVCDKLELREGRDYSTLVKNVRREEETTDNFDRFMDLLRRYVGAGIEELTPTMVYEFVKKIIVHEADKSSGKRVQKIEIIFNFIGELDFPAINQSIIVVKGLNEKTA